MLKHGELVMMESTDRLLQRDKECLIRLRVKKPVSTDLKSLDSVLPETTCVDPNEYLIKLFSSSEIESTLRDVRELGYEIDSMETENQDLEDVFLSIMKANPERSE
jgi:ABC-type multidrug transport system ATPase subunit